jgi:hypothetical protein
LILSGVIPDTDLKALISEHVFETTDGKRISFFHEGYFDYVFAKTFVADDGSLINLLTSGEQTLFRRLQVRQVLAFERDWNREAYLRDIQAILSADSIRTHIKESVLAFLGDLSDPCQDEWEILSSYVLDDGPLRDHTWKIFRNSRPWFELLLGLGFWEDQLSSEHGTLTDLTIWAMRGNLPVAEDEIAELIEPYLGKSLEWANRIRYLTSDTEVGVSKRFHDIVIAMITSGGFESTEGNARLVDLWTIAHPWIKHNPGWACQIIGRYLERGLLLHAQNPNRTNQNPFREDGPFFMSRVSSRELIELANVDPIQFLESTLPFLTKALEASACLPSELPIKDEIWWFRYKDTLHGFDDALFAAIEAALCCIAKTDPNALETVAAPLKALNFETAQFLIIRAYTVNPLQFADIAAEYLLEYPYRFEAGYIDAPYWAACELITAINSNCSNDNFARLEKSILTFYPEKGGRHRGESWGYEQYLLLNGLASSRLSGKGEQRLKELSRKFGDNSLPIPTKIEAHHVSSPVPISATTIMSDADWLSAISKYAGENTRQTRRDEVLGGSYELARALEIQVQLNPNRFLVLGLQLPNSTNCDYFEAVLRGAESGIEKVDLDILLKFCARCHDLPGRPVGRSISYVLGKLSVSPLPSQAVELLCWYAVSDPDPQNELWKTKTPTGNDVYYGGSVESAGLNSTRGGTANAIAALLWEDPKNIDAFSDVIDRLIQDPSTAVRSQVVEILTASLVHDRQRSIDRFLLLCDDCDDSLLSTRGVERYLRYGLQTHFSALRPIVGRMLNSDLDSVVETGARQVCLASLNHPEAAEFAESCLIGSPPARRGAAAIFAANLGIADHYDVSTSALLKLFKDEDASVREIASSCFREMKDRDLDSILEFARSFIMSPAYESNYRYLLDALGNATCDVAELACEAIGKFLDVAGDQARDITTSEAAVAVEAAELMVRFYSQSRASRERSLCLNIIDRMIQSNVWGIDSAINSALR